MRHDIVDRLTRQAAVCSAMGSALYGKVLALAADDYRSGGTVARILDVDASRSRLGIRLMATLHYLALAGDAELAAHFPSTGGDGDGGALWAIARKRFASETATIDGLMERTPQTNEPARAMPLMAGFCGLAARYRLPLRVFEIGASAGLNLRWDFFAYDGASWTFGGPSALRLRNSIVSGAPAHLEVAPQVAERRGCDLHPLEASSSVDRMELTSFVWSDQTERIARLRAALEVAKEHPVEVDRADMLVWIPRVATPVDGHLTVIAETVVSEHLPATVRHDLEQAIHIQGSFATSDAPFAWLRMEPRDGAYTTEFFTWPDYISEGVRIATSDGHAQGIAWTGA